VEVLGVVKLMVVEGATVLVKVSDPDVTTVTVGVRILVGVGTVGCGLPVRVGPLWIKEDQGVTRAPEGKATVPNDCT